MRSIWKGSITFSLVSIPIKVFNAIETSEKISFNQLHAGQNRMHIAGMQIFPDSLAT